MKYTVHICPIVRVTIRGVEADSQEEAMKKAEFEANFYAHFNGLSDTEYADDIDCFHVDEEGDEEYERSCWYDKNYVPL